jgi:hypothetical protein
VLVDFVCRPIGGTLACASDALDVKWASLSELAGHGVQPETIAVIERAFERVRSGPWTPREVHRHAQ